MALRQIEVLAVDETEARALVRAQFDAAGETGSEILTVRLVDEQIAPTGAPVSWRAVVRTVPPWVIQPAPPPGLVLAAAVREPLPPSAMGRRMGQARHLISAGIGRLVLAAGTAMMVMGVGSLILGPIAPSDGLGDYLLPSDAPIAMESTPPIVSAFPSLTPLPSATATAGATATAAPTPTPQTHSVTRIVISRANVDLPVISQPAKEKFPYCDVAETLDYYTVPGNNWVTYVYAHARAGMFGGLLVASRKPDSYLEGSLVQVYTSDDLVYTYKITEIHRHQKYTSWTVADSQTGETLILQTCEDASGVGPKVIIVAKPVKVGSASHGAAHPDANPRACH